MERLTNSEVNMRGEFGDGIYDWLHARVRKDFDLKEAMKKYRDAVSHRGATWDAVAERCLKIRENNIPEQKTLPNYDDYEGRFYKRNRCFEHNKWLTSRMMGNAVYCNLENTTTYRDANTELLESEINDLARMMSIPEQTAYAFEDMLYVGHGYVYVYWDAYDVTIGNETGCPKIEHINPMKMYIDHTTHKRDKSDMRYIFRVEKYDYRDLIKRYPHIKETLLNRMGVNAYDNLVELIIMQYKVEEFIECVTIEDTDDKTNKKWIFPLREWTRYINSGAEVPEGVEVSMPYFVRKEFWYECSFLPFVERLVEQPKYVGEFCSYQIIHYQPREDSAYDYGLTYYMMDLQDMDIILMTSLVLQVFQSMNQKELIVQDALVNQEEYLNKKGQLDVQPIVKPKWQKDNPGEKAVSPIPMAQFSDAIPMLSNMIGNDQKMTSGKTDTMAGVPPFANMSGVQTTALQSAGNMYHKQELLKQQQFIERIYKVILYLICEYRSHPHTVRHLGMDNEMENVPVNNPEESPFTFEPERTSISCSMEEDIEVLRQMKKQDARLLFGDGLLPPEEVLDAFGYDNAERLLRLADSRNGILGIIEGLKANPDLAQRLQQELAMRQQTSNA